MASEPTTIWSGANGEFSAGSADTLVDTLGNTLVDSSSNGLVDNGVTFTANPATVWSSNDGNA